MKYNFFTREVLDLKVFSIKTDKEYSILERLTDANWTSFKIQEIIDGVQESKEKPKGEEYVWANEDVTLYSNENGILLIDDISQRAGEKDPEKLNLGINTEEFIMFMQAFKLFVEENS